MIDDSGIEEEFPLGQVKRPILDKIVKFCAHLRDNNPPEIEKPLRSANLADVTTQWYSDFVALD